MTGALQRADTRARTTPRLREPGCCFFSDLVILGTADKPFVHLGTTELINKRGVKSKELKAGLSSAGCGGALMGLGERLCSQGDNNYGFGFEKSVGLDLHMLSLLPSPPPRISTSKQEGRSPE